ncbi:MAG: matrixin family metalloprotease [Candidatus Doudnabacteria bacterium]|nr:matrixin family metalloprotease [Candidatus Doudnabacteria bacterium]
MRRLISFATILIFIFAVSMISIVEAKGPAKQTPDKGVKAPQIEFVEEVFVDYKTPTHAGPGPHPTTESDDFSLTMGGISWIVSTTTKYKIEGGEPVSGANTALEAAEATWDGFVNPANFVRNDADPSPNPCGGSNRIEWGLIDGVGNALAFASVCRNVVTKEIVGFRMKLDTSETWSTNTPASDLDVENVASHEWGHVAGLGHTNKPASGCLTMYNFADDGETQKRTLGLGDKLGMDTFYATGITGPGPGCGF